MAYLTPANRSFVVPVPSAQAPALIERFCKEAFPGSRPYRSYNGRVNVSVNLGDGAYATVNIESRDLLPKEITDETPPGASRIEVSGWVSGFNIQDTPAGKAEVQRFLDTVANSLQNTLEGFGKSGQWHAKTRGIRMPRVGPPEKGVA